MNVVLGGYRFSSQARTPLVGTQLGWSVIEVRGPMDGAQAHAWEQSILRALRRRGAALAPSNISGKFTGYTEAWVAESYPARSLNELMDLVRDDEEAAPRRS